MSTFHYKGKHDEPLNGVKCDVCGFKLYTDTTGFEFGQHMRTAKAQGWLITKEGDKWMNYCPKCKEAKEEKKRRDYFT